MSKISFFSLCIIITTLISCGGGGGGSTNKSSNNSAFSSSNSSRSSSSSSIASSSHSSVESLFNINTISSIQQIENIIDIRNSNNNIYVLHSRNISDNPSKITESIYLYDYEKKTILAEMDTSKWIHHIQVQNDFIYTFDEDGAFRSYQIDIYAENKIKLIGEFSASEESNFELDGNTYIIFDQSKNIIFLTRYGKFYSLKFSEGSFFGFKKILDEIPHIESDNHWDLVNSKLYFWKSKGKLSEYSVEDDGTIKYITDIAYTTNLNELFLFKISHNGEILTTFDIKINSYKRVSINEFMQVDQVINANFDDWVSDFYMTNDGKGLAQWQSWPEGGESGHYKYFEVDINAEIHEYEQINCDTHNGWASYRNIFYSIPNGVFFGGGPVLVEYKKNDNIISCNLAPLLPGAAGIANPVSMNTNADSNFSFVIDSESKKISTLTKTDGKLTIVSQYSIINDIPAGYVSKLLISPDNKHLYLIANKSIYCFAIDENGSISLLKDSSVDISQDNQAINTGSATISNDGTRIYTFETRTFYFSTHYEDTPVITYYSRNPITGSLTLVSSIILNNDAVADSRIDNIGPIEISPDGNFLYAITKFWGIMNIYDLKNNGIPTYVGSYFDPYMFIGDPSVPESIQFDGISDASSLLFSNNGESLLMTVRGYSSFEPNIFKSESTDLTLVNFSRNIETGALTMRQKINNTHSKAYTSPLIRDNYLYAVNSPYIYGFNKSTGIDVYRIDAQGNFHFYQNFNELFFGEGISEIKFWLGEPEILGSNPYNGALISTSLK